MPLTNGYEYKYVFHEGDYENVSRREFDYRYGVSEVITGINLDNITTGYASLKAEWQFPKISISGYMRTARHLSMLLSRPMR